MRREDQDDFFAAMARHPSGKHRRPEQRTSPASGSGYVEAYFALGVAVVLAVGFGVLITSQVFFAFGVAGVAAVVAVVALIVLGVMSR